MNFELRV